jgi:hypothetical protein
MTLTNPDVTAQISTDTAPPWRLFAPGGKMLHAGVLLSLAVVVGASLVLGFQLRKWTWEMTAPIHFRSDINRGYNWGYEAAQHGYVNLYEKMSSQEPRWGLWLDYAPLRLAVMRMWAKTNIARYGDADSKKWRADWQFNRPALLFNMAMELLASVCAFLLTRLWVSRTSSDSKPYRGWIAGLVAGLLFWFNPAVLLSAHGWPTWDMWIIPMYLLAVVLASCNWWFAAGLVMAAGAMFKGQQLAVAVVFLVWPLFLLRFDAMLKWTIGLVFGIGVLASPWLLTYVPQTAIDAMRTVQFNDKRPPWEVDRLSLPTREWDVTAIVWLTLLVAATIAARTALSRVRDNSRRQFWIITTAVCLALFALASWPWLLSSNRSQLWVGVGSGCALAAIVPFVRNVRHIALLVASIVGAGLISTMWFFHGSSAWWICGWKYGTIHWPYMVMGVTSNLPGILRERYGWHEPTMPFDLLQIPAGAIFGWPKAVIVPTIGDVLKTLYGVMLVLSAIGVGLQARRKDPRILVAFATPWLMFFCFPPQIHERYLLYAAGVAVISIGVGVGPVLLAVLMSAITFIMTIHVMLNAGDRGELGRLLSEKYPSLFSPSAGETLHRFVSGTYPDIGWAVLLIAIIYLYLSLAPSARQKASLLSE